MSGDWTLGVPERGFAFRHRVDELIVDGGGVRLAVRRAGAVPARARRSRSRRTSAVRNRDQRRGSVDLPLPGEGPKAARDLEDGRHGGHPVLVRAGAAAPAKLTRACLSGFPSRLARIVAVTSPGIVSASTSTTSTAKRSCAGRRTKWSSALDGPNVSWQPGSKGAISQWSRPPRVGITSRPSDSPQIRISSSRRRAPVRVSTAHTWYTPPADPASSSRPPSNTAPVTPVGGTAPGRRRTARMTGPGPALAAETSLVR